MSVKSFVISRVAEVFTGERRMQAAREAAERARKRAGAPHVVRYFHQADDPYSHLGLQALALLAARHDIVVEPYLVGPPADWAAPDRARLIAHARTDAARLAAASGLDFDDPGRQPCGAAVAATSARLAGAIADGRFVDDGPAISAALWKDTKAGPDGPPATPHPACAAGEARRAELGHFMSAMLHMGGEWYWGVDRLHHLERRLDSLAVRKAGAPDALIWAPPDSPAPDARPVPAPAPELHYYLSFRSPYTWIATPRVVAMAQAWGVPLRLRFMLPMVMRGLPVPAMKRHYFTLDTAREARRLGVPFGRIADPVGRPVERGYSLLPWARDQGRGVEFCMAFMRAVWSQGVDAGADAGLRQIVQAAGLDWQAARAIVDNQDWRTEAEANREELLSLGQWGVPCLRLGDTIVWGQDRLWVIEDALRALAGGDGAV